MKDYDMEILTDVLCGKLSETDARFQKWLTDPENSALYLVLSGRTEAHDGSFEKEKVYSEIATILNFRRSSNRFSANWPKVVMIVSAAFMLTVGMILWLSPKKETTISAPHFQTGEKIAYLNTSDGEIIPLKEDFIRKGEFGTLMSNNKAEGVLSLEQISSPSKEGSQKTGKQILSVPKGGEYELQLCDGTRVFLNSETQLVFPEFFSEGTRKVSLTGEAFFDVVSNGAPFIVEMNGMAVEVKGTSFNINTRSVGSLVKTTLVEGEVDVHILGSGKSIRLESSEQLSFDPVTGETVVREVDTDIYTSWRRGIFTFRNQTLGEIFDQLSRWYNFNIEFARPEIAQMHFSGSAEKKRELDVLLNQIQMVTDIRCKKEGDKIILY